MPVEIPRIISVDDHVIEPPNVWQDRLPDKFKAVGPRLERRKVKNMKFVGGVFSYEAAGEHAGVEGLRLKLWVGDAGTERWGVVELFESRAAAEQEISTRAEEVIGKPPDIVEEFDLEGSVEGQFRTEDLSHRGLAFDED